MDLESLDDVIATSLLAICALCVAAGAALVLIVLWLAEHLTIAIHWH